MSGIDPQRIESASLTHVGQVRASNQDYCDEFVSPIGNRLLVVADGMGGHRGGATASRVATETIGEIFSGATEEPSEILYKALAEANRRVHQQSIDDPELRGMGTTVVSILFDTNGCVWVAHVGDSRAYRLHAAGMEQITQDHSVVGEMVRRGLITPEEAEVHPRRNEILRSVGVEAAVEIDVGQVQSAPGDFFLLCSDGLTGLVSDPEIAQILQSDTPENAAKQLVDLANERGGHDNVTVQIARVPGDATQTIDFDEKALRHELQQGSHHPQQEEQEEQQQEQQAPQDPPYRLIAGIGAVLLVSIVAYLAFSGDDAETQATNSGPPIATTDETDQTEEGDKNRSPIPQPEARRVEITP